MTFGLLVIAALGWAGWLLSLLDYSRLRKSLEAEQATDEATEVEQVNRYRRVMAALAARDEGAVHAPRVCACINCVARRLATGQGSN